MRCSDVGEDDDAKTTDTSPVLRRGTVITLERRTRPSVGEWDVSRTESYGQVAILGRSFDDVHSDWDMNRPFRAIALTNPVRRESQLDSTWTRMFRELSPGNSRVPTSCINSGAARI
jgi:hypothetical protein